MSNVTTCDACNGPTGGNAYCSRACRQRAYRARVRARLEAAHPGVLTLTASEAWGVAQSVKSHQGWLWGRPDGWTEVEWKKLTGGKTLAWPVAKFALLIGHYPGVVEVFEKGVVARRPNRA